MSDEIIAFDIGGRVFKTYYSTIAKMPDSLLAKMLDPTQRIPVKRDKKGRIFFDRNPDHFNVIIDYYRSGSLSTHSMTDEQLEDELNFWGINYEKEETQPDVPNEEINPFTIYFPRTHCSPAGRFVGIDKSKFPSWGNLTYTLCDMYERTLFIENCVQICGVVIRRTATCDTIPSCAGIRLCIGYMESDNKDDEDDEIAKMKRASCIYGNFEYLNLKNGLQENHIRCEPPVVINNGASATIIPCVTIGTSCKCVETLEFIYIYKTI